MIGVGCDGNGGSDDALDLEVEISAPATAYVGQAFSVSATATGTAHTFEWGGTAGPLAPLSLVDGAFSNRSVASPTVTICDIGPHTISAKVSGQVIPGVPGSGTASREVYVYPAPTHVISDTEFHESDWDLSADFSCNEPFPDTYTWNVSREETGGHSGSYRRLAEFALFDRNVGLASLDIEHIFVAQPYDPGELGSVQFVRFLFHGLVVGAKSRSFHPFIMQNGKIFPADSIWVNEGDGQWHSYSTDERLISDLPEQCNRDGTLDVDAPMHFGVTTSNLTYFPVDPDPHELILTGLDDFEVQLAASWSVDECLASADLCPDDPGKADPGECGCGIADDDSDGDGVADCVDDDACSFDPDKTDPGVCGCGIPEIDTDSDGTPDCVDADSCPDDPDKTAPGECGCGVSDINRDGDGEVDCHDGCPDDRDKTEPGACGCGTPDTDGDSNGTPDCMEGAVCAIVSGTWTLTQTGIDSSCGPEAGTAIETLTITQSGCSIQVTGIHDTSSIVMGSVGGDEVTIGPGDFAEDGGTTTLTYNLTLSSDTSLSGKESWSWSGNGSCSAGTSNLTATRIE